jgi:hypothetical protein
VLVDRNLAFVMWLRKLLDLAGCATVADGRRGRRLLERHGIEFVQAEITSIDVTRRSARRAQVRCRRTAEISTVSPLACNSRDRGRVCTNERPAQRHPAAPRAVGPVPPVTATSWGQVMGIGAGLLKASRGRSRDTSKKTAKTHRTMKNEAGSAW